MDNHPPPPQPPPYNLCNLTHFTSTLPALPLPTITVPYAVNVFASQPAEVAVHADEWLDNPTPEIDAMMKEWLADADMTWAPKSEEGQFSRTPAHSLSLPRKPLGDLSNMPLASQQTATKAVPSADNHQHQPTAQHTSMPPPQPVKTFSKKRQQQGQQGGPDQPKKKMLKLKTNRQQASSTKEEDILESMEGKRFGVLIAHVFEVHDASVHEEEEERVVEYEVLNELWTETAKLKSNGSLSRVPADVLSRLIQILDTYVKKGNNIRILEEEEERGEKVKEITVLYGFVAALVILHVFAADNLEKSLIVEEVIENMLQFAKFNVAHNIIPAFDPLMETKKTKGKKATERSKRLVGLLCCYLDVLNEFAAKEPLTDSMVLDICAVTIPTFFMEGGSELQLHALNVVRTIFSRYEKHRTLILEDIFTSLAKLPKTKRTLRTYRLPEDNKAIQMVSALVLQLIQCCPSLVKLAIVGTKKGIDLEPQKPQADGESAVTVSDANSYEAAAACALAFMKSFVAKCSTREEDNDYRQILTNFVEDLLMTINLPEWPASQVVLRVLSGILLKNVKKDSKESTVLKTFSIEILGNVTAKVKKEMALAQQWMEVLPGQTQDKDDSVSCICNTRHDDGQFMLDCDECHKWFHGACVGVIPENVPARWFCDTCLIRRKVRSRKNGDTGAAPSIDLSQASLDMSVDEPNEDEKSVDMSIDTREAHEIDVMRQMLLNYLGERTKMDPSVLFSRQFFISQWCHGENDEDKVQDYKSQWEVDSKRSLEIAERNERLLSRDGVMKIVRFLSTKGSLFLSFDSMLNQILGLMNEPLTTFRSKGLKALTAVLEADANTLGDPRVEQAVKGRFWDNAISVRSAAVDLVGKYVLERPEFASQYYPMIAERILDKGVTVRKHVVTILRNMCLGQPHHSLVPTICKKLVTRIGDEDESIKETVLKTFQELWFSPMPKKQDDANSETDSSAAKTLDMPARVDQLIEVVTISSSSQWFIDLLVSLLTKESKESGKHVHAICKVMVSCIVERIFAVDEQNVDQTTQQDQTKRIVRSMPAILHALHLFCQASPDLLVPHITTLHPYMKLLTNDNSEHLTAKNVIGIMESVAPLIEHPDPTFFAAVEKDLEELIYNIALISPLAWSVIAVAAKCLATFVQKLTSHHELVLGIVDRFQTYLDKCRAICTKQELLTPSRVLNAGRALYCLGHICRYYDATPTKKGAATKDPILHKTFNLLVIYAQSISTDLQLRATQAIGSIFVRAPELMLKSHVQTIIRKGLSSESHEVRLQMLLNISDFLAAEEAKALSATAGKNKKKSKKPVKAKAQAKPKGEDELDLDGSVDHNESLDESSHELFVEMDNSDSGVSNTIAQTFLESVLEQCLDTHPRVRTAALNTLAHIQRQGLMHPLQCVPHLVALETDRELAIADKAHRLLMTINEKYPSFLHNRFIDGIKLSYTFQKNTWGTCTALAPNSELPLSVLAQLYTLFSDKRTTRNFFLSSIIRLFEKCTSSEETDINFFRYLAELILSLPYTYADEVLSIIYYINRSVSFVGGTALVALETFFKKSKSNDKNPPAVAEDKLKISSMIMILLVLKHTLKRAYKLTDSRCKAYSPTETVKAREGKITEAPVIEFTADSSPFATITCDFDVDDMPALKTHYKEFKQVMREDEGDFDLKESTAKKSAAAKGRPRGRPRKVKAAEEEAEAEVEGEGDSEERSPVAQRTRPPARRTTRAKAKREESEESEEGQSEDGGAATKTKKNPAARKKRAAPARKATKRRRIGGDDDDSNDGDFVG